MEMKFNDHEQRLVAVEELISHTRQGMADASIKGRAVYFHFVIQSAFAYHYFSFTFPSHFVVREELTRLTKTGSSIRPFNPSVLSSSFALI